MAIIKPNLEIKVLSAGMIKYLTPDFPKEKPTMLLRIFNGTNGEKSKAEPKGYFPVHNPGAYVFIGEYQFDDYDEAVEGPQDDDAEEKYLLFSQQDAHDILNDVEKHIASVDRIVLHCVMGLSRSPAVALALTEIYGLPDDDLAHYFGNTHNRGVRYRLLSAASDLGIGRFASPTASGPIASSGNPTTPDQKGT